MITIPGTITGAAQTGFTSPTYTVTVDQPPANNCKQVAVTALGGTQAGVSAHSVSVPFLLSFWKPLVAAILGRPNPVTGLISNVPKNPYKLVTIKGVLPAANQPAQKLIVRTIAEVPAGAESYDAANVRAALSAHIGLLNSTSAGIGDTANNGIM